MTQKLAVFWILSEEKCNNFHNVFPKHAMNQKQIVKQHKRPEGAVVISTGSVTWNVSTAVIQMTLTHPIRQPVCKQTDQQTNLNSRRRKIHDPDPIWVEVVGIQFSGVDLRLRPRGS